jgi:hypothetical protein
LQYFTVQPVNDDGSVDNSRLVSLEATSPLKAGEAAMGRRLLLKGPSERARAIVWRLTTDLVAVSVLLYDRDDREAKLDVR